MVRCFLVHTVCPLPGAVSGSESGSGSGSESRLLYCRHFGPDETLVGSEPQRELKAEERRLLRRERVAAVARSVCLSV